MSDIRLTKKQILYITEMLEIPVPEAAAERFLKLMAEEGADGMDIGLYIDKIIARTKK